jgi:hypothetical protein
VSFAKVREEGRVVKESLFGIIHELLFSSFSPRFNSRVGKRAFQSCGKQEQPFALRLSEALLKL